MQTRLLTFVLSNYEPKRSKIHYPKTATHTVDLAIACHKGWVPYSELNPLTFNPCIYSTPFVSPFDSLNEISSIKKNFTVVKINFHGGKNQFPRW